MSAKNSFERQFSFLFLPRERLFCEDGEKFRMEMFVGNVFPMQLKKIRSIYSGVSVLVGCLGALFPSSTFPSHEPETELLTALSILSFVDVGWRGSISCLVFNFRRGSLTKCLTLKQLLTNIRYERSSFNDGRKQKESRRRSKKGIFVITKEMLCITPAHPFSHLGRWSSLRSPAENVFLAFSYSWAEKWNEIQDRYVTSATFLKSSLSSQRILFGEHERLAQGDPYFKRVGNSLLTCAVHQIWLLHFNHAVFYCELNGYNEFWEQKKFHLWSKPWSESRLKRIFAFSQVIRYNGVTVLSNN